MLGISKQHSSTYAEEAEMRNLKYKALTDTIRQEFYE